MSPLAPVFLVPHAEVAERVLLPGDPGRALRLAQGLTRSPKMLNHHRGLWGYTGAAADGRPLTVQGSGLGGPAVAAVAEELAGLGARRIVRVGTARRLDASVPLGLLVVARTAACGDGTSRALGAGPTVLPDPELTRALEAAAGAAGRPGIVASADLFYPAQDGPAAGAADASVTDLETAALLAVAHRLGVRAASVLLVTGDAADPGPRLTGPALHAAEDELGRVGAVALGA